MSQPGNETGKRDEDENTLPQWLSDRIAIRYNNCKPQEKFEGQNLSEEYYKGYRQALTWVLQQKKHICMGCSMHDCSHHGDNQYVCDGDCEPEK